ncbi:hypothetical protein CEE37_00425 [candidate division LCP-89 bacterium B3_LCP]|uniref:ATPase n=1 Tax=candidate division LCP-89 bacterium B3_LCP TaxID=2012998 RepID=A0A532V4P1_UNCL8|nr:MAG: hypothetical protein CEE37_00425 [candidate division LCP-89 bacterium B3_LCP]
MLDKIDFGLGAAQQERRQLRNYFYRSGSFALACSDKTYIILGAKGAGKSAIFQMFSELESEIPIFAPPNLWISDEPKLRDHWATLQPLGISSQVILWRFYIASLIANLCLEQPNFPSELRSAFERFLVRWGLVNEVPTAWQSMRSIKITVGLGDHIKTEIPPKKALAATEIDYVIYSADQWFEESGADLWICLDSLDEVSINGHDHDNVEDLLSNLMRAVAELLRLKRIRFKLFFRSDVYHSLTYVNKDHFSALKLDLEWSREDLAILLAHRIRPLHPSHDNLLTFPTSLEWINEIFDWKKGKIPNSFDQLYELLKDGNGNVLPRDLINFCIAAQRTQQNFNNQDINTPTNGKLVSWQAIHEAVERTAASKLNDFLQVFQNYKDTYDQLKGSASRCFSRSELSKALGREDSLDANIVIADLVRVGAIAIKDRRAVNLSDSFEIPFLYSLALEIGEGDE